MALDFVAGCLGGCAGVMVGHPFDTIKIHMQIQDASRPLHRGTLHCLRNLIAQNGARSLYRGMSSPLAGVAAINAIVFGVYGNVQRRLSDPNALKSHCFAGAVAGLSQSILTSPMELVKSRVQLIGGSPLQCLLDIKRVEGLRGVFRGLGITVAREVPSFSSYFVTYELLTRNDSGQPISTARMLFAGGFAGAVSWVLTYPIDVVKSRMQTDGVNGPRKYMNSLDCLRKSIQLEGYSCLSRGLNSTIIRAFPTNAACFAVVSWTFRLCSTEHEMHSTLHEHKQETSLWESVKIAVRNLKESETVTA